MSFADDLTKLADLKKQGVITAEEFDAQKKVLLEKGLNENKPKPAPAPAPAPNIPVLPKKKSGCLWQVMKIGGVVVLLCVLGSYMRSCNKSAARMPNVASVDNRNFAEGQTVQAVQEAPQPNAGLRAVLSEQEAWRVDFKAKIANYPEKTQQALNDGMTYLSAFQEYLNAMNNGDNDGVATSRDAMNALKDKIRTADPIAWESVERVGAKMNKQSQDNPDIKFNYTSVGKGVLAYHAAIQKARGLQEQSR